jgi:hypothetical protein
VTKVSSIVSIWKSLCLFVVCADHTLLPYIQVGFRYTSLWLSKRRESATLVAFQGVSSDSRNTIPLFL